METYAQQHHHEMVFGMMEEEEEMQNDDYYNDNNNNNNNSTFHHHRSSSSVRQHQQQHHPLQHQSQEQINNENEVEVDVMELVLQLTMASGYIDYRDGMHVGMINRFCHEQWCNNHFRENHPDLLLFLNLLERSNSTNYCLDCQLIYCPTSLAQCTCRRRRSRNKNKMIMMIDDDEEEEDRLFQRYDPRAKSDYDDLSTYEKCRQMAMYYKWLVSNLHSHYNHFQNVTQILPDSASIPFQLDQYLFANDDDHDDQQEEEEEESSNVLLLDVPADVKHMRRTSPRRYALCLHLVSLAVAQDQLCSKGEYPLGAYFASAFAGRMQHGDIRRTTATTTTTTTTTLLESSLAEQVLENLHVLCPGTDQDLEHFLRTYCYVQDWLMEEEGERIAWFAMKFSMFRPFFHICPPTMATAASATAAADHHTLLNLKSLELE